MFPYFKYCSICRDASVYSRQNGTEKIYYVQKNCLKIVFCNGMVSKIQPSLN